MECALGLSVHKMSLPFDHTCCLDKSELEMCLRFLVSENGNRNLQSEFDPSHSSSNSLNSILSTNTSTFDTISTPTPINSTF